MKALVPLERIENKIYLIRGQKVILDFDLARLYQVPTKRLKEQVKRNKDRFPDDFMFQLTWNELVFLRSQFATLKNKGSKRGKHTKYLPYAFTEQGVAMLSSILKSKGAIQVNIIIMRTFVKLRQILSTHKAVVAKLKEHEQKINKYGGEIQLIFNAIRKMIAPAKRPKRRFGFKV